MITLQHTKKKEVPMNILIVEDEVRLADALAQIMEEQKYFVDVVYDGQSGLDYALLSDYQVIVLDVMLPKMNGFEVAKELRKQGNSTPIILLTAKDEVMDKITGLDSGADDYMTKPFVPEELLARIRALSRRTGDVVLNQLNFGNTTLDLSTSNLSCADKSIHLAFKEFEIMKLLLSRPTMILSKEDLILKVWGNDSNAEDNNVEAYISFIRKKLLYLKSNLKITTIRKVGYHLEVNHD